MDEKETKNGEMAAGGRTKWRGKCAEHLWEVGCRMLQAGVQKKEVCWVGIIVR